MIGPLPYVGGKRRIARALATLIPPHVTYVEPFAGGAQLFFHKPASKVEILNDLDLDVVNFLRVCQRHPAELIRTLSNQPPSRQVFHWHQQQPVELLTDIERAARFLYLQKNTWGGRRDRRHFHYGVTKRSNYSPSRLGPRIEEAASRLSEVLLENLPYEEVLERYDRETTFFYCDPPYVDVQAYQHNFTDSQFQDLAQRLHRLKGRFLLSLNNCTKARQWFGEFECREVSFTYTAASPAKRFTELLFANFPLPQSIRALTTGDQVESHENKRTLFVRRRQSENGAAAD